MFSHLVGSVQPPPHRADFLKNWRDAQLEKDAFCF